MALGNSEKNLGARERSKNGGEMIVQNPRWILADSSARRPFAIGDDQKIEYENNKHAWERDQDGIWYKVKWKWK